MVAATHCLVHFSLLTQKVRKKACGLSFFLKQTFSILHWFSSSTSKMIRVNFNYIHNRKALEKITVLLTLFLANFVIQNVEQVKNGFEK